MVSAETALALPAVLLVLALCLSAVQLGVDRVRCVDAARVVVRELARGEDPARAEALGRRAAPDGASVTTSVDGQEARARVAVRTPPLLSWVGATTGCEAVARTERADVGG